MMKRVLSAKFVEGSHFAPRLQVGIVIAGPLTDLPCIGYLGLDISEVPPSHYIYSGSAVLLVHAYIH